MKKKLKWVKTFEYYMNKYTPEYYLCYSSDFNLPIDGIIDLILSVDGVKEASFNMHKYIKNTPVIIFSIKPEANEGLVFSKVFNLLEENLKGHSIVVKEKMW